MAGGADEGGEAGGAGAKRMRVESLGWLTESAVQPKKGKAIDGVGAASLEEVRRHKDGLPDAADGPIRKKGGIELARNSGVEERDKKDKLALKSSDPTSQCYAALERKAALYDKLVRGEAPDDEEVYNVDFLSKGLLVEDTRSDEETPVANSASFHWDYNAPEPRRDTGRHEQSPATQHEDEQRIQTEKVEEERRRKQREVITDLAQHTKAGRERAALLKQKRQEQGEKNRQKLRAQFLAKQAKLINNKASSVATSLPTS
eukprot:jgi/Chlat1/5435/Chrsp36S05438